MLRTCPAAGDPEELQETGARQGQIESLQVLSEAQTMPVPLVEMARSLETFTHSSRLGCGMVLLEASGAFGVLSRKPAEVGLSSALPQVGLRAVEPVLNGFERYSCHFRGGETSSSGGLKGIPVSDWRGGRPTRGQTQHSFTTTRPRATTRSMLLSVVSSRNSSHKISPNTRTVALAVTVKSTQ